MNNLYFIKDNIHTEIWVEANEGNIKYYLKEETDSSIEINETVYAGYVAKYFTDGLNAYQVITKEGDFYTAKLKAASSISELVDTGVTSIDIVGHLTPEQIFEL